MSFTDTKLAITSISVTSDDGTTSSVTGTGSEITVSNGDQSALYYSCTYSIQFLHHMCTYTNADLYILYIFSVYIHKNISHTYHKSTLYVYNSMPTPIHPPKTKQNNKQASKRTNKQTNKPTLMALSSGETGAHKQHAGSSML